MHCNTHICVIKKYVRERERCKYLNINSYSKICGRFLFFFAFTVYMPFKFKIASGVHAFFSISILLKSVSHYFVMLITNQEWNPILCRSEWLRFTVQNILKNWIKWPKISPSLSKSISNSLVYDMYTGVELLQCSFLCCLQPKPKLYDIKQKWLVKYPLGMLEVCRVNCFKRDLFMVLTP